MRLGLMFILFVDVMWAIFNVVYSESTNEAANIQFPAFEPPELDLIDLSEGCGGFADCIEYVGAAVVNIFRLLLFLILVIIELLSFILGTLIVIFTHAFTGIDGAPWWFNVGIVTILLGMTSFSVYRALRKGDTTA